ncbi:hypothetical protein R1T16_13820 [Flavobacterium sp. DG1-102-2]|uniref:hypothetical protein n=1 Tax=Flavobacterium sp. DG1-102-2 TaxID=3081663 RepID=UPI002949875E|nr:hypothetical protein [Flavobacterium sp. DG1-102-2]MDV6169509.1 hypothetical protein [Flavobacterium sp. DG1-102-2]
MISKFNEDLSKEEFLGRYLDSKYPELFPTCKMQRVTEKTLQHKGVDIIITTRGKSYNVDEKAQLDYLNKSLPTFAFEISYLKEGQEKLGWLLDESKITDKYFLITGIYLNTANDYRQGIKSCKITSVDRAGLLDLLNTKGLTKSEIMGVNGGMRDKGVDGRFEIEQLHPENEGRFHFSKSLKAEQPINIVLYLKYLVDLGVAKSIT